MPDAPGVRRLLRSAPPTPRHRHSPSAKPSWRCLRSCRTADSQSSLSQKNMKFSFSLIKKLAPGKYTKAELAEKLNLYSFETADVGGDILEIAVPPNRFSDAASHLGVAREASVLFNCRLNDPTLVKFKPDHQDFGVFRTAIKDKHLGRRYLAAYVTNIKVGSSPKWIKDALETCGLRSVNNVVDVMNYVMLEIGQPLHAFDADKVSGGLAVRKAKKGETIETIDPVRSSPPPGSFGPRLRAGAASNGVDGQKLNLDSEVLVIADVKKPLAIAGIKGGKASEVTSNTKRILVESANFDGTSIYNSSKKLNLKTDASLRFSHNLSPELAALGMQRALMLLKEIAGAKIHRPVDLYPKKQRRAALKIDAKRISKLIGETWKEKEVLNLLIKLGFKIKGRLAEVPLLRTDIENLEDIAEEAVRFRGYNNLISQPPAVALGFAEEEEAVLLKDRARSFLAGAGYSEVYNYSLVSKIDTELAPPIVFGSGAKPAELENPISKQLEVLRDSLAAALARNLKDNSRFLEETRIFEIGRVFSRKKSEVLEATALGVALNSKNAALELKGLVDGLFQKLGVVDYFLPDLNYQNKLLKSQESLRIENSNHEIVGYLGSLAGLRGAVLELNLDKLLKSIDEEKEYEPLSKYPSIIRDLSIFVPEEVRVGHILEMIQRVSSKLVNDVDLIDFYEPPAVARPQSDKSKDEEPRRKSLTFRIVFQAEDRTLIDAEVDREMAVINQVLIDKFDAELR